MMDTMAKRIGNLKKSRMAGGKKRNKLIFSSFDAITLDFMA